MIISVQVNNRPSHYRTDPYHTVTINLSNGKTYSMAADPGTDPSCDS